MPVTFLTNEDKAILDQNITALTEEIAEVKSELDAQPNPSKNLNASHYVSKEINGVTFTVNDDNSISLSGTATAGVWYSSAVENRSYRYEIKAGKYFLSGAVSSSMKSNILMYADTVTTTVIAEYHDTGNGVAFEVENDCWACVQLYVAKGTIADGNTFRIQVEEGISKTEYVSPFVTDGWHSEKFGLLESELNIQPKYSNNLNKSTYFDKKTNGVTFKVNDDNSVSLSGTATGYAYAFTGVEQNKPARFFLPAGTYTLSGSHSEKVCGYALLHESQTSESAIGEYRDNGAGVTFTAETDCYCVVQLLVWTGYVADGITLKMQLEEGTTATGYVSPWGSHPYSKRLADIETAFKKLDATVNPRVVPDYYFENGYLPGKVARINELMRTCSNNGDVFAFITDTHWEKNAGKSPALLNYIRKNTHIDRLFGGGDYIDAANSNTEMYDVSTIFRDAWSGPIYFTLGNHDYMGDAAYRGTDASLYWDWNSYGTERVGNLSRNYYYVDNPQMKMRYIVLNRYIDRGEENAEINGLNEEQRTWLQNVALDVETDWTVLVFVHDLYRFIYGDDGYTATMSLNYSDSNATVTILDAFVESGGTVAGIFCGEAHVDMVNYTPGGIPVITTTCDKNTGTEAALPIADQFEERLSGTIKEQVIDVMVVNKNTRTITAVRIGYQARNSVEGSYGELVEERTITY